MTDRTPERAKLNLAIDRLAKDQPLHAGILSRWQFEENRDVGTLAVGFREDKLRLVFSPEFIKSVSLNELESQLGRRVEAVLLQLKSPLGSDGIVAPEEQEEEQSETPAPAADVRASKDDYMNVEEDKEGEYSESPAPSSLGWPQGNLTEGGADEDWSGLAGLDDGPLKVDKIQVKGTRVDRALAKEMKGNRQGARGAINLDAVLAMGALSKADQGKLPEHIMAAVMDASKETGIGRGWGGAGDNLASICSTLHGGVASMPWQSILRRYIGKTRTRRAIFGRPPRRFPEMVGVIPGKGRFTSSPRIMAVIDTSGSMSDSALADISAELGKMNRHYEVIVVECDTAIREVYPYRKIEIVVGRGGTDFHPPFEPPFLKEHCPDLVVYFTDGYGTAPETAPRIPVIWCLINGGIRPSGWGREIWIQEPIMMAK